MIIHAIASYICGSAGRCGLQLRILILVILRVLSSAIVVLAVVLWLRMEGHGVVLLLMLLAVAAAGMLEFVFFRILVAAFFLRSFLDRPVFEVCLVGAASCLSSSSSSWIPVFMVHLS